MAGRGPAPKDRDKRARRNDEGPRVTKLPFQRAEQPELPMGDERWPQRTREWWAMLGEAAQTQQITAFDWEFLLETAMLHARFWGGESNLAGELRLRVAKFGATPEDRQRLRYEFAEEPPPKPSMQGRVSERYADLRVIPGGAADAVEA